MGQCSVLHVTSQAQQCSVMQYSARAVFHLKQSGDSASACGWNTPVRLSTIWRLPAFRIRLALSLSTSWKATCSARSSFCSPRQGRGVGTACRLICVQAACHTHTERQRAREKERERGRQRRRYCLPSALCVQALFHTHPHAHTHTQRRRYCMQFHMRAGPMSRTRTHTHTHTRARARAHAHVHAHARVHACKGKRARQRTHAHAHSKPSKEQSMRTSYNQLMQGANMRAPKV